MNKLLTLVNLELKRNRKIFGLYIITFLILTLGLNLFQILSLRINRELLHEIEERFGGVSYGIGIVCNNIYLIIIIAIGILGLLLYGVYMWVREYNEINKSMYTLLMIPNNKFNIYLGKMIALIVMIYTYLLSQIIVIFISKNIFNMIFKNLNIIKTSISSDLNFSFVGLSRTINNIIPTEFIDFIMIYGVNLILVISILFTAFIIGLSLREGSKISLVSSILLPIFIYILIVYRFLSKGYFMLGGAYIGYLGVDLIFNLLIIVILNSISYVLMNKEIYI